MNDAITVRYDLDDRHLSMWRDDVCDRMLDADARCSSARRLGASFGVTAVAGVVLLDARAHEAGLSLSRTPARVARSSTPPTLGLSLCLAGEAQIVSRGREHVLRAGELCLLSSVEPFAKALSADYREQFLYLPVPVALALGRPTPHLAQEALIAPRRGLGAVLADTMLSVADERAGMSATDWQTALGAVFELTTGVFGKAADPARTAGATRDAQHARAVRYIDAHLADPDLAPATIAAGLGMSPRYLHVVFEDGASVGATILARRLDRCRAALVDPRNPRSISEIAFAWGFNDAAHFSRTFRARFGASPRDLRAAARRAGSSDQ